VQLTSFVGRETDCKAVTDLLVDHRLVTITGVGGVGKTRLALQAAAELLPEFDDGAWVAELAQAEDEQALADVVALALHAPSRPGLSPLDSIVEFLQPRELLLVIDNCEHLIARASDLIERTLQSCPHVRILATSREGLGVPGEHLWPLRSLATPAAGSFACSSTGHTPSIPRSRSTPRTRRASATSAAGSTASRSHSSWRRPASGRWGPKRSPRCSTSGSVS
jgi:predicted ATPase